MQPCGQYVEAHIRMKACRCKRRLLLLGLPQVDAILGMSWLAAADPIRSAAYESAAQPLCAASQAYLHKHHLCASRWAVHGSSFKTLPDMQGELTCVLCGRARLGLAAA